MPGKILDFASLPFSESRPRSTRTVVTYVNSAGEGHSDPGAGQHQKTQRFPKGIPSATIGPLSESGRLLGT